MDNGRINDVVIPFTYATKGEKVEDNEENYTSFPHLIWLRRVYKQL